MATTATTPSELLIAIDTTVRNQTTPNSITPITHSDLLYNVVEVLSANTYTTGGTYISSASTIDFSTNNGVNYNVDLSELDSVYLPLTGGTITGNVNTDTLKIQTLGTGTSVTNLGIDSSGNVVSGITNNTETLRYKALLTQSGTDAPREVDTNNNNILPFVDTINGVLSYSTVGVFHYTKVGAFVNSDKVNIEVGYQGQMSPNAAVYASVLNDDTIVIHSALVSGYNQFAFLTPTNQLMFILPITIEIYP